MDPNETLINILNDLRQSRNPNFSHVRRDGHKAAAAEALHDLAFWLEKGGFAPEVTLTGLSGDADVRVTSGFTVDYRGSR